ncbi:MAG: hypothetical protein A2583_01275 [Bdellovibrionales bacterium RIFOXYD1_FULL_53_11]|nr:MAG: hypothetical protein A2583_01275 [Bdellovibrionales bacterium RIFOXYD1_FULL_53_11]
MSFKFACIVEGHGEVSALPVLIRRMINERNLSFDFEIPTPFRLPRGRFTKKEDFRRAVDFSSRKIAGSGAIIVLLDADDDCPVDLKNMLFGFIAEMNKNISVKIIIAKREFETWFVAAARSLAGKRGLSDVLDPPSQSEDIRDAKGWLGRKMIQGCTYSETVDQPAFAGVFDMAEARRNSKSFNKFFQDICSLLPEV